MATLAPAAAQGLALTENRNLRFFVVFILYVAQGLPLGLFYFALPGWQAQNGASAAAVGAVLAMTALPWSLKLINGVVMDRWAFLAMGRRRPWLIVGQLGIVIGLLAFAWTNPGARDAALLGAFAFAINVATTIQDVAIDGMAVDVLTEDEFARASGLMFGGQAIGMSAGSALSGFMLAQYGFQAAMGTLALLVGVILTIVLVVRERPGERLLPWSAGAASAVSTERHLGAFWPIFRNLLRAMNQRHILLFLPAMFMGGAGYGLFTGLAPLFAANVLGWSDDSYASWSGQAYLIAGIGGALAFGFVAEFFGAHRTYGAAHLLAAAAAIALYALQPSWSVAAILIAAIFIFNAQTVMLGVSGSAVAMRCCVPAVAATQFSLFMATNNLGISVASASLGALDAAGGLPAMVAALAAVSIIGAAFAFAAKAWR